MEPAAGTARDDRTRHRPGVLQYRDELRDRRSLLADDRQACLVANTRTHMVVRPAARRQKAMASTDASKRMDWTITGVEEPALRPSAASAEASIKLCASTARSRAGDVPRVSITIISVKSH